MMQYIFRQIKRLSLLILLMVLSGITLSDVYISDELFKAAYERRKKEEYEHLSRLRNHVLVLSHQDIARLDELRLVTDNYLNTIDGKYDRSEFSVTAIKFYPVFKGKTLKPNLVVAMGLSLRAIGFYQEYLLKNGFNTHRTISSTLANAKFEYDIDLDR